MKQIGHCMRGESDCCISYYDQYLTGSTLREEKLILTPLRLCGVREQNVSLHKSGGCAVDSSGPP